MGTDPLTPSTAAEPKATAASVVATPSAAEIDQREINWSEEREGKRLMCNTQPATLVYSNPQDQIVVRQEAACGRCDEDSFVFFSQAVLPELIAELARFLPDEAGDAVRSALIHNDLLKHKF